MGPELSKSSVTESQRPTNQPTMTSPTARQRDTINVQTSLEKIDDASTSTPKMATYHERQPSSIGLPTEPLLQEAPSYSSLFSTPGEDDRDSVSYKHAKGYGFGAIAASDVDEELYKSRHDLSYVSNYKHKALQHPLGQRFCNFESPQWRNFIIHVVFCIITYPVLFLLALAANNKDLFWARVLVGAGCSLMGILLGGSLLTLSKPFLEAAAWATLIHQSTVKENAGVPLQDFAAHTEEPYGGFGALKLLWDRRRYPGAERMRRRHYDRRPWSIWILLFLANVALAGGVTFILGRVVDIQVNIARQYHNYREVAVKGDLTADDLKRADELSQTFQNYAFSWTFNPVTVQGVLPPVVSLRWALSKPSQSSNTTALSEDDMVYFSEVTKNQLLPDGSGFGAFSSASSWTNLSSMNNSNPSSSEPSSMSLKLPRWGIRIKCEKTADIIPSSESHMSYIFTPRDILRRLFSHFNTSLPEIFERPLNTTKVLFSSNDTLPSAEKLAQYAMGAYFYDNGVANAMYNAPISNGGNGSIYVIERLLVRLNTTYAPNGTFAALNNPVLDGRGNMTYIGYDAAVCLQVYEPWIVEVYNTSAGVPNSLKIWDKGPEVHDMSRSQEVLRGKSLDNGNGLSRALNYSNIWTMYSVARSSVMNQIMKDSGRDSFYLPSPTLISYTDGEGALGYTELSASHLARSRVITEASNILPYLVGSGSVIARLYEDQKLSVVTILNGYFAILISVVFIMGTISTFLVPRLPLGSPRRGFDLISWVTAFSSHEIVPDYANKFEKQMELEDIVQRASQLRMRYVGDGKG